MLLLKDDQLEARRVAARGPLQPLFTSLLRELDPVLARDLYVPESKALLSRAGGRCERDGTTLEFDPFSPDAHRCSTCGAVHTGEWHHRAWVTSYQLWLAERALHAALFNLLEPNERHASFARDTLRALADRYLKYPNRDNVLGPTRLFFSTYLESIWLLQVCVAADFLERAGDRATAELVRSDIVTPSAALIAEFDEGMSNRQVWNNAALLAATELTKDSAAFEERVETESGLHAHLERALLSDGTWYEGENYHQFALRGLWYGVTLAEACGVRLPDNAARRFDAAFLAPFVTALPDFTMPSRKDSQFAVSLRQWRIAELTELGAARTRNPALFAALARCYESGHERRDTGRSRSAADVERNSPGGLLTRADLGWRALLHALPELPAAKTSASRSALLEGQGFAVFRREGDVYVGVDYGQSGGGHGHPDRLNIILSRGPARVLDDLGTGSYVDPSLHWYRSTLAHNAPLIDGHSQQLSDGQLLAYDEREGLGWIVGELTQGETTIERAVFVAPDYLIDELRWTSAKSVRLELPLHLDADVEGAQMHRAPLDGGAGLEDGFAHAKDTKALDVAAGATTILHARGDARDVRAFLWSQSPRVLFSASARGQPVTEPHSFYVQRATAQQGTLRAVLSWATSVRSVAFDSDSTVVELEGERHTHKRDAAGWHVELTAAGARSSVDLSGFRKRAMSGAPTNEAVCAPTPIARSKDTLTFDLAERHYRRSESTWADAGSPRAKVTISADQKRLTIVASVAAGHAHFASGDAANAFDNEHADTMRAGIQLYARTPDGAGAWMLVPEKAPAVRTRAIAGWGELASPGAQWKATADGYEMRIALDIPKSKAEFPIDIDLIVNETSRERQRRRGQLVLSGARGEFAYLRGDRHDASRLIPLVILP